jgi:hypothetical protein
MPTPTIPAGNLFMNATLYTGNSPSSQTITNGVAGQSFQPDFVWLKSRSAAYNSGLYDSVRGVSKLLYSNTTDAQITSTGGVTAFNSNGFTILNDASNSNINVSGTTYVGWNWKAGGTAVSNTAGSITSQVSANTTSGFSIVTWTGNGTSGATVGHGLGTVPSMVIVKRRSAASNWSVSLAAIGATKVLFLEQTAAAATDPGPFASTLPSSTVITLGSSTDTNASGGTFVAYCWAPIAGYSQFGSYTGNGSTDGPFIYTGFRPKFILAKRTNTTGSWNMVDSSRSPSNVAIPTLYSDLSDAEYTGYNFADLNSNGFKLRSTVAANGSGDTYIYMAFAENPFKYANAQ